VRTGNKGLLSLLHTPSDGPCAFHALVVRASFVDESHDAGNEENGEQRGDVVHGECNVNRYCFPNSVGTKCGKISYLPPDQTDTAAVNAIL
jgi:hypothetical protein